MPQSAATSFESIARWRPWFSFLWMVALLAWETSSPCVRQFASGEARKVHGLRNLAVAIANAFVVALVFAGLWRWIANAAEFRGFGLLNAIGGNGSGPLRTIAAIVLLDAWTYGWHRAAHGLPWLWRFHRVHHSDPTMDVTTANRFHPGEIVVSSILRLAVVPLLGIRFGELVLYETALQFLVQLQHANVALPPLVERWAGLVFVTPGMHKVHHSVEPAETDSNYGSLGSFWDRALGTFRSRRDTGKLRFGLEGQDGEDRQTLGTLMRWPWEHD